MSNTVDFTEEYQEFTPDEIKNNLSLYKDLSNRLSQVQEKLEGNFYRVHDTNKLKEYVNSGRLRVGKYSIIEEQGSEYKLVNFADFFEKEFKEIIKLLEKLAESCSNDKYKEYILSLVYAYKNNNFIDPYKKWVQIGSKLDYDFLFFPTEPYFDKEFEVILSFESHLKITAKDSSIFKEGNLEETVSNIILNIPKFSEVHSNFEMDKFSLRVDYTLLSSAATPKFKFIGQNLPNERVFVSMWGTKGNIYKTQIDNQISQEYSSLKEIFKDPDLTDNDFSEGMTRVLFSHEVTESLMKFEGDEARLKSMYLAVRELNADVSGIRNYVLFLLKTENHDEKVKKIVYFHVLSLFKYYKQYHNNPASTQHSYGYLYTFNYLLDKNAISIDESQKVSIDIKKVLQCITEISEQTTDILINGTEDEAKEFFEPYKKEDTIKELLNIS